MEPKQAKDGSCYLWVKRAMIIVSTLIAIMHFYNKRMVALFKFEDKFDQYLTESDMEPYEKHQLTQMKAIDPSEYYKTVEAYYHGLYPSLDFYVILSSDIKEYPTNSIVKPLYILLLFLKELLGIRPGGNLNPPPENSVPSLSEEVPVVKALAYYEWVPDSFYELLLKYCFFF